MNAQAGIPIRIPPCCCTRITRREHDTLIELIDLRNADAAADVARLTRAIETLRRQLAHAEDVAAFWYAEAERLEQRYTDLRQAGAAPRGKRRDGAKVQL